MESRLRQELSAIKRQLQQLATSLGFKDAYEAQTAIDASHFGLTYMSSLERLQESTQTVLTQAAEIKRLKKETVVLRRKNAAQREVLRALSPKNFPLGRDAEVAGYLFSFLPDFSSLISASLCCKFLYGVFEAGRRTITRAVAFNQIGPALPQALRLARFEAARDLPTEDSALRTDISKQEAVILARNAEVAIEFENLFSWKNKDRRSTTSVLSEKESFRFQRAVYRVMLLCFAYGMGSNFEWMVGEDSPDEYQSQQRDFLEEFPTPELYEIKRVAFFVRYVGSIRLLETDKFIGSLAVYDFDSLILFAGPRLILQFYKYRNSFDPILQYLEGDGCTGFITSPLEQILSDRDGLGHLRHPGFSRIILDNIYGEGESCSKCNTECEIYAGVHLVNDTCWGDQIGHLKESLGMWSRKLWYNPTESKFQETMRNIDDYRAFMDTLFDARCGEYISWMKSEWICCQCLSSLWWDTLPVWWLQQRLQEGIPIKPDCWYGNMCDKQSKPDFDHAKKFNHVCKRTRFDYQQ